jgi:hypothetical protein
VPTTKGLLESEKVKTSALVTAAFRPSKTWCWREDHYQG